MTNVYGENHIVGGEHIEQKMMKGCKARLRIYTGTPSPAWQDCHLHCFFESPLLPADASERVPTLHIQRPT